MINLLLLQIGFEQIYDSVAVRVQGDIGASEEFLEGALEGLQVVEVFVCQLMGLLDLRPVRAGCLLYLVKGGL